VLIKWSVVDNVCKQMVCFVCKKAEDFSVFRIDTSPSTPADPGDFYCFNHTQKPNNQPSITGTIVRSNYQLFCIIPLLLKTIIQPQV